MKQFLYFAGIPLGLFVIFFGLPHLFATLINSHSDVGVLTILMIVCGIFGIIANKIYNNVKEN